MDGEQEPVTINRCPVCGKESTEYVNRQGELKLYRCRQGHFFLPDEISCAELPTEISDLK